MSVMDEILAVTVQATQSYAAGRVFVGNPPQDYAYQGPYIVIRGVGAISNEELRGNSVALGSERIEFSCRSRQMSGFQHGGYGTSRAMAEQIRLAFQNFVQPSPPGELYGGSFASRVSTYDEDQKLHVMLLDMEMEYSEAVS